jgi:hypothetical protein
MVFDNLIETKIGVTAASSHGSVFKTSAGFERQPTTQLPLNPQQHLIF